MRYWYPALVLVLIAPAWGDVIFLTDGTKIDGTIEHVTNGWAITDLHGNIRVVAEDQVKTVEKSNTAPGPEEVRSHLDSLRRAMTFVSDANIGIERYQKFIDANKDSPVVRDAQKDLATWQERRDKHMVKIADRWLTPEEQAAYMQQVAAKAEDIRQLLKQSRTREAESAVAEMLRQDPTNVAAMYLRGYILLKQEQVIQARQQFEQVRTALPTHAPTLNNLAIIAWRQRQYPGAINLYDQAMAAAPSNRQILDNTAEAIYGLPADNRDAPIVKKAVKRFDEQDAVLQQTMGQSGWFRWGSTWVNQAQLDLIHAAEKDIKARLDDLAKEYDRMESQIRRNDTEIDLNNRYMARMDSERSVAVDSSGRFIAMPLPGEYYRLQRDNDLLKADQRELMGKLAAIREKGKSIEQQLPVPKYTGVQTAIGPEGTPLATPGQAPPPRGTEAPASRPTP